MPVPPHPLDGSPAVVLGGRPVVLHAAGRGRDRSRSAASWRACRRASSCTTFAGRGSGFGCSAHSYDGQRTRWSNERDAARYTKLMKDGRTPVVETIELDERASRAEAIFLGLRLMRGVNLSEHHARFGADLRAEYAADLERLSDAGLIEFDDDLMRLTTSGALLSNEVFSTFV